MSKATRRKFLGEVGLALGTAALIEPAMNLANVAASAPTEQETVKAVPAASDPSSPIDFRFSPMSWQTAYCFPDDHHKSLVGNRGELRIGHPGMGIGIDFFPEIVEFSVKGMETDRVEWQRLEAPGVPLICTRIDRPEVFLELITFATRRANEGRVDNVMMEFRPRTARSLHAVPLIVLKTKRTVHLQAAARTTDLRLDSPANAPFLIADAPLSLDEDGAFYKKYAFQTGVAAEGKPLRYFIRLPQEGQSQDSLKEGLADPDGLLDEARQYWLGWKPYEGHVSWSIPGRHGEFLVACARNILQAREEKTGKVTFQVGPTVYRGLWVVDGNFILEAARYLGYDKEAQEGLETTWSHQEASGGIFAGGGREHWKDTGIAMFTLVRQAELGQDWSYFRHMQSNIQRAVQFLVSLRDQARRGNSVNGRYGLLAPGFGDGGLGGVRSEFTNTLWVLAGLKAVIRAANHLELPGFDPARQFYKELRASFFVAARREMRRHPDGFMYLPMLVNEDLQWSVLHPWDRPRPQTAQWALSQAIYPGLVFDRDDPIVKGHIRLMQSCTQEDIPAETGWLNHGGVWNYNAAFVAHVYLWAGVADWAQLTFAGYLNHASPLYCWREEQPLHDSLTAGYVGDMPHNWASAECILYLRNMLALEDGENLRLLLGVGADDLVGGKPVSLTHSPTKFGRIGLDIEPLDGGHGWRLKFHRGNGPQPQSVLLPPRLGGRFSFEKVVGAKVLLKRNILQVSPGAASWEAFWKEK